MKYIMDLKYYVKNDFTIYTSFLVLCGKGVLGDGDGMDGYFIGRGQKFGGGIFWKTDTLKNENETGT
jgi:hypothetical protein